MPWWKWWWPKTCAVCRAILSVIAKDTASERIRIEVELLTDIISCTLGPTEIPADFANMYMSTVARCANHNGMLPDSAHRQFSVLLLRNAVLSPDTINALTFQLTNKGSHEVHKVDINISVSDEEARKLLSTINESSNGCSPSGESNHLFVCHYIERALNDFESVKDDTYTSINLEKTVAALSQVRIHGTDATISQDKSHNPLKTSMLGKRQFPEDSNSKRNDYIKKLKSDDPCCICKKKGHWWKDRPDCREKMFESRKNKGNPNSGDHGEKGGEGK